MNCEGREGAEHTLTHGKREGLTQQDDGRRRPSTGILSVGELVFFR